MVDDAEPSPTPPEASVSDGSPNVVRDPDWLGAMADEAARDVTVPTPVVSALAPPAPVAPPTTVAPVMAPPHVPGAEPSSAPASAAPASAAPASAAPASAWRTRARRVGIGLLALALLGGGAVAGWAMRSTRDEPSVDLAVTVTRPVEVVEAAGVVDGVLPNVLGLDEASARDALSQAGLGRDQVAVTEIPAAGQPGVVVGQEPDPGSSIGPVALSISVPARMPDLLGTPQREARQRLAALGAGVVVSEVYRAGATPGAVTATNPPAGATVPPSVELTVAATPSSVYLTQLDPVDGGCSADEATVNATPFAESVVCSLGSDGEPERVEYLLNRRIAAFEATFGLIDESDPGYRARLRVLVDGRAVAEFEAGYGESVPVAVPTDGGLRIGFELYAVGPDECCPTLRAALGGARLVGGPVAIDALTAES